MNRTLPKLVFLTDSSEVTPWTRARSSGRHSLGAGSEFSDATPWTRARSSGRHSLGAGAGSDSSDATPWAGSDSSDAIYNFIGV
ncbi:MULTISPECIES: hypothetical protein [Paenibacillus]|uniref:hypothetical protein n=1 Tax=Paenibacillus TaxID=44249 RepID=UPI001C4BED41|nr:hypothetical protein [Paenibacillus odorifer]